MLTTLDENLEERQSKLVMNPKYALYYSKYCYFCQKVMMNLRGREDLNIDLRSTSEREHASALMSGGGKTQVPCLKIDDGSGNVQWMYESDDIIAYFASV